MIERVPTVWHIGADFESVSAKNYSGTSGPPITKKMKILMVGRETYSLWFYLGFCKNWGGSGKSKWRLPDFLKKKPWKNLIFWADSFYTPFFKHIGCRIFGHKNPLTPVYDQDDVCGKMCNRCYRFPIREYIQKAKLKNMPLYINDEDLKIQKIAAERLRIGK